MTEQSEVLSAGDARARVAVLEAEVAELRKRVCVPEGWVVVPAEPTIDMSVAARRAMRADISIGNAEHVYRAMLAAAPAQHDIATALKHVPVTYGNSSAAPAPVERVEQAACTGKNCGSTDPNLHSAECFAEHEQAIAPTAARKAPPEDPLCGIEYRADGEANFYTLSAAAGSWIARIQFNGRFYPHEQERILSAMLGDRNVRYGDGYYDGFWAASKNSAAAQDVAGLPFVRKILEKLERFCECAEDDEGVDIGRHWLDVLTRLGLLNRVQRSPARWEMTAQADDALEAAHQSGGAK